MYEKEGRNPPCDTTGICYYTKTEDPPPKLDGYAFFAWNLWATKEILGESAMILEMESFSDLEKKMLIVLIKDIEMLALRYEIKQPKQCLGG